MMMFIFGVVVLVVIILLGATTTPMPAQNPSANHLASDAEDVRILCVYVSVMYLCV